MSKEPKKYLEAKKYSELADALNMINSMIIFSFAKYDCSTRDIIIRNFLSRAAVSLKSIFLLYDSQDFPNAWVIHRTMLDRMFHLYSIGINDEFEIFDDWSFFNQYKEQNRLKSDPKFNHQASGWVYEHSKKQKERINTLSKSKPKWKRPKAEEVAKNMEMSFLYKYGYDFASKLVHPLSDDGLQDFYEITGLQPRPKYPSQIIILSNTILASSLLIQTALNQSSFSWIKLLWDVVDQVRYALDGNNEQYKISIAKLYMHLDESKDISAPKQA